MNPLTNHSLMAALQNRHHYRDWLTFLMTLLSHNMLLCLPLCLSFTMTLLMFLTTLQAPLQLHQALLHHQTLLCHQPLPYLHHPIHHLHRYLSMLHDGLNVSQFLPNLHG